MSHRKYHAPRHGSLAFLPRKRAARMRGNVKTFPKDDANKAPHFTAFMGYKVGMTHIVRDLDKPGSKMHKKEILEPVTMIECPPMIVVGVVGYAESPSGLKTVGSVFAQHLSEGFIRRMYKSWYNAKKKAFTKYIRHYKSRQKKIETRLNQIKQNSTIIRAIAHTQTTKIPNLNQKKAHVMEIQINGGKDVAAKVDFAVSFFEKNVPIDAVFAANEMVDLLGVTKGKGREGVITRWGVRRLPRKTHRGLRKVACIGAWHPARVSYAVARGGQLGCHRRTDINKKIYMVGKHHFGMKMQNHGKTDFDLTKKPINPMGGFPHYGTIRNDFVMIKGSVLGPFKRVITLRKPLVPQATRAAKEDVKVKFIDTSSKMGRGRFQTKAEKRKFMGKRKADRLRDEARAAKALKAKEAAVQAQAKKL